MNKNISWADKMTQWAKALAAKADNLVQSLEALQEKERTDSCKFPSTSAHSPTRNPITPQTNIK